VILRGIHVAHWCCIARLDLDDLPGGNVVLYGPNRTGKSSLVKALRGCLFDFDHDTTKAELKNCLPWNGAGPPTVAVEFETAGELYRITKVFSKRVDGLARLERKAGDQWRVLEDSPREASRKTRELLGAEKSQLGLNQLLWLDQGVVELPEAKDLDTSLEKRLVAVLGVMVTGRDLGFKQALDKRYDRWFGVRGDFKPTSSVTGWNKQKEERQKKLAEQQTKFHEVEQAIEALDTCERQVPDFERAVRVAKQELDELLREKERSLQRRQQYQKALQDFREAQQQLQAVEGRLHIYHAAKQRWKEAEQEAAQAEAAFEVASQEQSRLAEEHAGRASAVQAARLAVDENLLTRVEIEDCRKLLGLSEQRARVASALERARELHEMVAKLERQIRDAKAPDKATLESLRENRDKAAKLRATLQAEALTLRVTLTQPVSLRLQLDGDLAQDMELPPDKQHEWPLRQRARVEIPGTGRVEVARSQENRNLELSAQQLARLHREYRECVLGFGEQPSDTACLNRLTERRLEREKAVAKLEVARRDLQQAAPHGIGMLEGDLEKLDTQYQVILNRRPDLAGWRPSEADVAARERQFQMRADALLKVRGEWEKAEKQASQELQMATGRVRSCNDKAVAARTTARNAREELERYGDDLALEAVAGQARQALTNAEHRLTEAELTEAERSIEQRCVDAETALKLRTDRLEQLKRELERHRGRLEGSEGLHTRLADAEAAVREAEDALARENLEAAAHKRLRDLFEQCRDSQVQQVMAPIAGRVLRWAQAIGLSEYQEFRFGDRFLPEGLILHNGDADKPRSLADESYGTAEQLGILVRLALGGVLAKDEPVVALLDDPLAHADAGKHRRILDILRMAAEGSPAWTPSAGRVQTLIFTCHPDRFDYLPGARQIDLAKLIVRET
jgi:energy-coupling factor transporter ATP-binding protein EcfA2